MSQQDKFRSISNPLILSYLEGDAGGRVSSDQQNVVFVKGVTGSPILTEGNPAAHTLSITIKDATQLNKGAIALASDAEVTAGVDDDKAVTASSLKIKLGAQTDKGIAYGQTTAAVLGWTRALRDGELLIGSTGGAPKAGQLTSTNSTVTITKKDGSINLEVGGQHSSSFETNSGTATPSAGVIKILGAKGIETEASGNTITVEGREPVVLRFDTDSGSVRPENHILEIDGGTLIDTEGAENEITIKATEQVASVFETDQVGAQAIPSQNKLKIKGGSGVVTKIVNNDIVIDSGGEHSSAFEGNQGRAVPSQGLLKLLGGKNLTTTAQNNEVTFNVDGTVASSFGTDSGSAVPNNSTLNIRGFTNCSTRALGNMVSINVSATVPNTFQTDAGNATGSASTLRILGGTNCSTKASGNTVTIDAQGGGGGSGGFEWVEVKSRTFTLLRKRHFFLPYNSDTITLQIPGSFVKGDWFSITSANSNYFTIKPLSGVTIEFSFGTQTGDQLLSRDVRASIFLFCTRVDENGKIFFQPFGGFSGNYELTTP